MNKKIWSIILLCVIIVTAVVIVSAGISLYRLESAEIDTSNDKFPGASIAGAALLSITVLGVFIFIGGMASVGFLCSLVNSKIAENMIISRISKAFLCFYSAVLILIFVFAVILI